MLLALAIAAIALRLTSSDGRVLFHDARAPWIMADAPVTGHLRGLGEDAERITRFGRDFEIATPGASDATLRLRAFGEPILRLNDVAVPLPAEPEGAGFDPWRALDVRQWLHPGVNHIEVDVRNPRGPALLALEIVGSGWSLGTGPDWGAGEPGIPGNAIVATDRRPMADALQGESPTRSLFARWALLVVLLAIAAPLTALLRRPVSRLADPTLVRWIWTAVVCAWLFWFGAKLAPLSLAYGFDAPAHIAYIDHLRTHDGWPSARDGWAMHHPPLFYWASLWLSRGLVALGVSPLEAPKLLPFVSGLALAWLGFALCRLLWPGDRATWLYALVFAAFVPLNLTAAAYLSNEGLAAAFGGAALLLACRILLADRVPARETAVLSLLLGLALLTKVSALLVVATAGTAVALRIAACHAREPATLASRLAALVLPAAALSGGFFARNVALYGRPLVGNWSLEGLGFQWWSPPGFHTTAYYTRFGEVFHRPFLSGVVSFWDALYSTLWGDGLIGGQISIATRHGQWDYQLMAAGYLLALPATALLLVGAGCATRGALRDPSPGRRAALALVLGLCAVTGFAILYGTLVLPYFGQARALYGLVTVPALAVFFALGARQVERWLPEPSGRIAVGSVTAATLGWFYLSFAW